MIRLRCPECDKALAMKDELAGKTISSPQCKHRALVIDPEAILERRPHPAPAQGRVILRLF